jgi:MarR family transcriptional regulator, organic hydroperoxide resistance regulator
MSPKRSALPMPAALQTLSVMQGMLEALRRAVESDERLAGYSHAEKLLLVHLGQPLRMGEVAQALHCLPSNVTALVDQLEDKGLLRREPSPDDRRAKRLVLTDAGQVARKQVIAISAELFAGVTGFNDAEFKEILGMLNRGRDA